ncbi:aspartate/glutamate racemase family protein [Marinibacterium sp. SX1]|uniref:aspartate/glutamate racemase family protein n=1 Tax=Marinibacterium sp. SX1 TaxID=3388424 RepID=UPI003D174CBA
MPHLVRVIVPIPLPQEALDAFAAQLPPDLIAPGFAVDFVGTRNGGQLGGDQMEALLFDAFVYDAGVSAERDGCAAVCVNSMSDSGVAALRARLNIPVVGSGATALLMACQLGGRFSIVSMWDRWNHFYKKILAEQGLAPRCASLRDVGVRPDTAELLAGKEDFIFDALEAECRRAIDEDGAEVIVLGSTTMHQSHAHLARVLPVPVINPGVVSYKAAEALVQMGLAQSRAQYHTPERPMDDIFAHVPAVFP